MKISASRAQAESQSRVSCHTRQQAHRDIVSQLASPRQARREFADSAVLLGSSR